MVNNQTPKRRRLATQDAPSTTPAARKQVAPSGKLAGKALDLGGRAQGARCGGPKAVQEQRAGQSVCLDAVSAMPNPPQRRFSLHKTTSGKFLVR